MNDKKKIGRPTDELKDIKITVRISQETNKRLEQFSEENKLTKAESVRKAIERLPIKNEK